MWHHIADLVGDDCGFEANGQVKVVETEDQWRQQASLVAALREDGLVHEEMIDAVTLRALAPAIAHHCLGARIVRDDGAADPHRTLAAFHRSALAAGVRIHEGVGVRTLERIENVWRAGDGGTHYEAPLLVNAAGAWAGEIAELAGDQIPLAPPKASMMIVTERTAPFLRPTVIATGRTLSFKQTAQGTVLIGGGQQGWADVSNETAHVDVLGLAKSAAAAVAIFPTAGRLRIVRSWAGLESNSPDGVAIAGLSPRSPSLMHLFGFAGHGFQLVPSLGVVAAELLLDGRSSIDIDGLAPARLMDGSAGPRRTAARI
ncbi:sarcosine oxidase subunit beta [Novosphingobium sp. SG751A]|nr:sarcosine oxidase subunit beta [Novosphingobium sp. SG751A]